MNFWGTVLQTSREVIFAGGGWQGWVTFVFVVWATVGLFVNFFGVTLPPAMFWADAFFLSLAAALVFLALARRDGGVRSAGIFFVVAIFTGALEAFGTLTGVPFGQYYYSDRMGWKIGGVLPFTIPLAWWAIVGSGHFVLRYLFPAWPRLVLSVGVGLWALVHDILLEPFAWKVRGYWSWGTWDAPLSAVPMQNYATWFVTAAVMGALLPLGGVKSRWDWRPAIVTFFMLATFFVGIVGHNICGCDFRSAYRSSFFQYLPGESVVSSRTANRSWFAVYFFGW